MSRPSILESITVRHRFARSAVALSLLATMGVALVTQPEVRAQDSPLLSTSTVTPAEVAIYAEVRLDPENEEIRLLDELFLRLGSEESLIDAIENSAQDATGEVDISNAEIAFVVLPSALEDAAEAGTPNFGDLSDPDSVATDLEEAGVGVNDEGIAIVVRPTDVAEFESLAADEAGTEAETEEYLSHDIVSYTGDDGDNAVYVVIEDFFVYATSVADVKLFVDVAEDGSDSLADVDEFTTASNALPSERVAFAYMNGEVFIDSATSAMDDQSLGPIVTDVFSTYRAHFGVTLGADADGITLESVAIPADGSTVEPRDDDDALTYAAQMPEDTVVFASGHDLGDTTVLRSLGLALVAGFASITSDGMDDSEATPEATPAPATVEALYDGVAQFLGFNIKTDFIDQMTGPYAFGVWNIDTEDPADIGAVLVSGVADPMTLGDTVGSISTLVQAAGQGEVSVVSRQVGGATVNNVSFDNNGSMMSVDFGIIEDQFVLGVGDGVDTLLLGPDGSLEDSPRYTAAVSKLPSEYEAIQYVDVATLSSINSGIADDMVGDLLATPVAGGMSQTQPEAFAMVTYTEDGFSRMSAILIVP